MTLSAFVTLTPDSLFAFGKGTEALLLKTPLPVSWLDWAREALTATLAAQILALPLWVLRGYYAIVAGGWLWNATRPEAPQNEW